MRDPNEGPGERIRCCGPTAGAVAPKNDHSFPNKGDDESRFLRDDASDTTGRGLHGRSVVRSDRSM